MKKLGFLLTLLFSILLINATISAQISISSSTPVTENFNGIGTAATASLPTNWRMSGAGVGSTSGYTTAGNFTAINQAASSGAPTAGGRYNWATTAGTDRAIGFMTSGSYASPNSIMSFYRNTSGSTINDLSIAFQFERYRQNSSIASVTFFTSTDGTTWTARTAGDIPATDFPTGANVYTFATPLTITRNISLTGVNIPNSGDFYLRWIVNTTGTNSQGIGLDDVSLTATLEPIDTTAPETTIDSSPSNPSSSADATFTFSGTDNIGVTGFDCSLDGAAFTVCTSPTTYTGLTNGSHTFQVRAKDAAGNVDATPASYTWTINTTPPSNIDLTITRETFDESADAGDTVTFTIVVSNGGTTVANNVSATFAVPVGLTYSASTVVSGGFAVSQSGGVVTFSGGTISGGGFATLTVSATADTAGTKATSFNSQVVVDPANSIVETNETNNTAPDNVEVRVRFQSPVVGLSGRPNLAQLLADVADIGISRDNNFENIVRLNQNLTGEDTNIFVPSSVYLDFSTFTVSGTANITFGPALQTLGNIVGAGFKTANINGLGDAEHPGSIQLSGTRTFNGATSAEFYSSAPVPTLGLLVQNAYGMPTEIDVFEIDNPAGLNIFAPFNINGDLFLTRGIINNGANTITLSASARNNGSNIGTGNNTTFINGAIEKRIPFFGGVQFGGATCYIFPVGTVGGPQAAYSPMQMCWNSANFGDSLKVRVFDTNSPSVTTPSLSRYWQLDETGDINVDLDFNWVDGDEAGLNPETDLRVFRNTVSACTLTSNCVVNLATNVASIDGVSDFSPWTVAQFIPSAANVEIGGKVLNTRGNAISNARVFITDQNGTVRSVRTNNFGNYKFEGLNAGEIYILTAQSRENTFGSRIVTPQENVTDLDITAID